MKTPSQIITSSKAKLVFAFVMLFSISYADDFTASISGNAKWSDIAIWTINESPADRVPGISDNVTISSSGNWLAMYEDFTSKPTYYANNVTINNTHFATKDESEKPTPWSTWGPVWVIAQNFTINGNSMFSNQSWNVAGEGFDQIKIGGNFYINSGETLLGWGNGYSESHYALDVAGTVEIAAGARLAINWNDSIWGAASTTHRIGGLNSNGGALLRSGSQGSKTTVVFGGDDFKGGDFTGNIAQVASSSNNTFLIKMDSPNNQKQTLRIKSTTTYNALASLDVEIAGGHMEISNEDDATSKITSLNLKGAGQFGVAGDTSSASIGSLYVGTLNWTSGTNLLIDLMNDGSSDGIYLDAINFTNPTASYNILFDFVDFTDPESNEFRIIFKNSGMFTADDVIKLSGQSSDGLYDAVFSGADSNTIKVSFVAVPEPAEIAAFFGAVALAFAAYRRRK